MSKPEKKSAPKKRGRGHKSKYGVQLHRPDTDDSIFTKSSSRVLHDREDFVKVRKPVAEDFKNEYRDLYPSTLGVLPPAAKLRNPVNIDIQEGDTEFEISLFQPLLVILRGMPGSGKTSIAEKIVAHFGEDNVAWCSEDHAHVDPETGEFKWDRTKHRQSKEDCRAKVVKSIEENVPVVLVDNAHAQRWTYMHHVKKAIEAGYMIRIIEFEHGGDLVRRFKARNTKNIPESQWMRLVEEWEPDERAVKIRPRFNDAKREEDREFNKESLLELFLPAFKQESPHEFAYVTLVMKGDAYVPGALALAHSIKTAGCKYPVICMITKDVHAKEALGAVFDEVITVPYFEVPCSEFLSPKQKSKYDRWICQSFTKWQCLRLNSLSVLYHLKKVLFLDADKIVIDKSTDDLFQLQSPAGTFSSPWARGYQYTSNTDSLRQMDIGLDRFARVEQRHRKGTSLKDYYEGHIEHGEVVPRKLIGKSFLEYGFVAPGTCVLLDVHDHLFDRLMSMMNPKSGSDGFGRAGDSGTYGWPQCWSGHDEQAIVQLFWDLKKDWTHIDRGFNYIPWHDQWMEGFTPRVLHYFGKNVWEMKRDEWPDVQAWWNVVENLVKQDYDDDEEKKAIEEVFKHKALKETPGALCFKCNSKDHDFIDSKTGALCCPVMLAELERVNERARKQSKRRAREREKAEREGGSRGKKRKREDSEEEPEDDKDLIEKEDDDEFSERAVKRRRLAEFKKKLDKRAKRFEDENEEDVDMANEGALQSLLPRSMRKDKGKNDADEGWSTVPLDADTRKKRRAKFGAMASEDLEMEKSPPRRQQRRKNRDKPDRWRDRGATQGIFGGGDDIPAAIREARSKRFGNVPGSKPKKAPEEPMSEDFKVTIDNEAEDKTSKKDKEEAMSEDFKVTIDNDAGGEAPEKSAEAAPEEIEEDF